MDTRFTNVLSSSVSILSLLVYTFKDTPHLQTLISRPSFLKLIGSSRLWSLAASDSIIIRKSIYVFIKSVCQSVPSIIHDRIKLIASNYLGKVFTVGGASVEMWDSLLVFTKLVPQSWEINTGIVQDLFAFWKGGANGHLASSYPCLLPLLSVMPNNVWRSILIRDR
jgi:hypothetical protein